LPCDARVRALKGDLKGAGDLLHESLAIKLSHGRVQRWSRLHLRVQPLPYTRGYMVAPTPIIVEDHPTDSQKWVVLHRDGKCL